MSVYTEKDMVTVVDEDGNESEVPKKWLGTSLLPEGVKKAEGTRRRATAKDPVAEELAEAKAAAEAAAAEVVKLQAQVDALKAAAAAGQSAPADLKK